MKGGVKMSAEKKDERATVRIDSEAKEKLKKIMEARGIRAMAPMISAIITEEYFRLQKEGKI